MNNCVLTITGQKGSGKTTFAKSLVPLCPRRIVVDRLLEWENGQPFRKLDPAIDYLVTHWFDRELAVTIRFRTDYEHTLFFEFLRTSLDIEAAPLPPPTLLCIEEIDFFARPNSIDPWLRDLYNYGRHWNLSLIGLVRRDTGTHPDVTGASDAIAAFRQHKFSADMRDKFTGEQLAQIMRLETLTPGVAAQNGKHYLTHPENSQIIEMLVKACAAPTLP